MTMTINTVDSSVSIQAVVLDTETTDAGKSPQPCEVAWLGIGEVPDLKIGQIFNSRFDITCPMSFGAEKIHKISKASLAGLPVYQDVSQLQIPSSARYMICHNAPFDYDKVLRRPDGFKPICTLALSRKLFPITEGCSMSPSGKFRSYKLVDLCSDLFPARREFIFSGAHGALFDSKLTLMLLHYIVANWGLGSFDEVYDLQHS